MRIGLNQVACKPNQVDFLSCNQSDLTKLSEPIADIIESRKEVLDEVANFQSLELLGELTLLEEVKRVC